MMFSSRLVLVPRLFCLPKTSLPVYRAWFVRSRLHSHWSCASFRNMCKSTQGQVSSIRLLLALPRNHMKITVIVGSGITLLSRCWKSQTLLTAFCEMAKNPVIAIQKPNQQQFILWRIINSIYGFIRINLRGLRLFLTFFPLLIMYPLTLLSVRVNFLYWKLMLFAVECSGPAFIKLGQWASTRRDLFSKEFCDRFSKLHHHTNAHSWRDTVKILDQSYGKKWRNFFLFDKNAEPIGSGCIAQVYKAYVQEKNLKENDLEKIEEAIHEREMAELVLNEQRIFSEGVDIEQLMDLIPVSRRQYSNAELNLVTEPGKKTTEYDAENLIPVAVKVLHPGVRTVFSRDLTLMKWMANFVQFVFPSLRWVSLTECVEEFSIAMKKQMNMRHEARCLHRLAQDFTKVSYVQIPVTLWPLLRNNVLVETFEEGEPISNFLKSGDEDGQDLRNKLAELGVNALLQMVFVNNFVHGDLHPGNILVQNAADFKKEEESLVVVNLRVKKAECPVKLVFLDCGITATLSEEDRVKFREVFTAVVQGQGEAVADLFLEKTAHVECLNPDAFRKEMAAIVTKARKATMRLSQIHVTELLSEVFNVLRTHRVKLESNFATVILAIAVLEGLGRSLDSDLDILEKARPILLHKALFG